MKIYTKTATNEKATIIFLQDIKDHLSQQCYIQELMQCIFHFCVFNYSEQRRESGSILICKYREVSWSITTGSTQCACAHTGYTKVSSNFCNHINVDPQFATNLLLCTQLMKSCWICCILGSKALLLCHYHILTMQFFYCFIVVVILYIIYCIEH